SRQHPSLSIVISTATNQPGTVPKRATPYRSSRLTVSTNASRRSRGGGLRWSPRRSAVINFRAFWLLAFSPLVLVESFDESAPFDLPRNLVRDELFWIGVLRRGHRA